jgi:hypothetical protein
MLSISALTPSAHINVNKGVSLQYDLKALENVRHTCAKLSANPFRFVACFGTKRRNGSQG